MGFQDEDWRQRTVILADQVEDRLGEDKLVGILEIRDVVWVQGDWKDAGEVLDED